MQACRYALLQLPKIVAVKDIGKFVLAGENDLNQLFFIGFEICQQPNFFKQFRA